MKNFLTFALKLGIIFIKFAFLMAVCLGKAAFVCLVVLLRLLGRSSDGRAEAEAKGLSVNPLDGKVL
ncbi:hypothetical protein [Uliginosibacterium gangwonense]|uniref:hypothetical protein n=1 Tax=Uliginosibacterium gangwonense TaxID=392736 RepID=UPI00036E6202|nr:hypothetical protein [Uliginosibacterium gangwonense]